MEAVDLQMEDIFGDGEDDPFSTHADIPDLPPDLGITNQPTDEQNIENDAVLARLRDLSRGAATRTVKRVQPKLDPTRLTGDRGIGVLPQIFKDIRFKGKGHEAEDLKKVMRYLEHWTHRLFPKMPFDEVLQRIEKLGTKKEVQTYIKRMRMDIPEGNEDNPTDEADEILDDSADRTGERGQLTTSIGADEEEVLDEIMREEEAEYKVRQSQVDHSTNQSSSKLTTESQTQSTTSFTPGTPEGLTTEQLERIEANKRKAQERRMAKLGHKTPGMPSGGQADTPLAYPTTPSTGQSVSSLQQAATASPAVVPVTRLEPSPSKVPKLDLQAESDQLTEDQLLAGLEDEQTCEEAKASLSQIQDESLSPLHLDATEILSQNTIPVAEVSKGKAAHDNSEGTEADAIGQVAKDSEKNVSHDCSTI